MGCYVVWNVVKAKIGYAHFALDGVYVAAVFFGWPTGAAVPADEEGFYGGAEFVKLGLRGLVDGVVWHEGRAYAFFKKGFDFVGEYDGSFSDLYYFSYFYHF